MERAALADNVSQETCHELVRCALRSTREAVGLNAVLQEELSALILIEQAKGFLSERFDVSIDTAGECLRRAARTNRVATRTVARSLVDSTSTPLEVLEELLELIGASHDGTGWWGDARCGCDLSYRYALTTKGVLFWRQTSASTYRAAPVDEGTCNRCDYPLAALVFGGAARHRTGQPSPR